MKRTKKIALILMTVVLMAVCFVFGASAERAIVDSGECGAQGDNVTWVLYDDGELVISGEGAISNHSSSSDVPWNDYSYNIITSIVIEEGITDIGYSSFYGNNIEKISLPDSINSIGSYNFESTKYYNNQENWKDGALYINNHLIKVDNSLTDFVVPDNVLTIAADAFDANIVSITIGKNVKNVAMHCFDFMFYGSFKLETIKVHDDNPYYSNDENGVLFNKDKTKLIRYPSANKKSEYVIPNSVVELGVGAFAYSMFLEEVVLPSSLTWLPYVAFYQAYSLSDINLDYIKNIGEGALYTCAFENITVPNTVKKIDSGAIMCCYYLEKIYVESMDIELSDISLNPLDCYYRDISKEEYVELIIDAVLNDSSDLWEYQVRFDGFGFLSTIYCHSGSTAETYAIENGIDYELTHFFKGEWTYDYDNMIRTRKCIHCDELETEPLESTESGDVEIIEPVDPDTDFEVDEIEKNSDKYILVEDSLKEHHHGHWDIVKMFDISLKNKDGVHVQPDGTVKVKLPHDWKHEHYKVYRVNDDGTLTDMNAYREGSHIVFETDHFSLYVIVDESEKTEPEVPETPEVPEQPDTSDCNCICHKEGFFFEILASVFKFVAKFLGVFPVCDCGMAHY